MAQSDVWHTKRGRVYVSHVRRDSNRWLYTLIGPNAVDDPACSRDNDEPSSAFAQYLLPRLKKSKDDAAKEVLINMKSGRALGDAIADTIETLPASKTKRLRSWVNEAQSTRIYPYVHIFTSLQYDGTDFQAFLDIGLLMTMDGSPGGEPFVEAVIVRGQKAEEFQGIKIPSGTPMSWQFIVKKAFDDEMDKRALREADVWFTAIQHEKLNLVKACADIRRLSSSYAQT